MGCWSVEGFASQLSRSPVAGNRTGGLNPIALGPIRPLGFSVLGAVDSATLPRHPAHKCLAHRIAAAADPTLDSRWGRMEFRRYAL